MCPPQLVLPLRKPLHMAVCVPIPVSPTHSPILPMHFGGPTGDIHEHPPSQGDAATAHTHTHQALLLRKLPWLCWGRSAFCSVWEGPSLQGLRGAVCLCAHTHALNASFAPHFAACFVFTYSFRDEVWSRDVSCQL